LRQYWLDILGALHATDLACLRGANTDWSRQIELWVGVREPDHWQPLVDRFQRVFSALTYDHLILHFEPDTNPVPPPRQRQNPLPDADCVALLSGGIDSLTGAGLLLTGAHKPLFLSHQNSGAVAGALRAVHDVLNPLGQSAGDLTFTARVERLKPESTQRSRSMLYMGIACLLAACLGRHEVYLNENGVMAINVPLTAARVGSYSTRTASPTIVRDFARLASTALGRDLVVHNLLVTKTKPEVVETAMELQLGSVLPRSVSCWWIGRTGKHCGYCVPCILRRISCEYASAPDATYGQNPLDCIPPDASWRDAATDNVVQLAAHAIGLDECDDLDFELEFPELLNCGDQITRDETFAMHRRWAQQCLAIMRTHPGAARVIDR
jgi:7-cyano-7-deazaguanine synthase in queuosine biosynthesis